MPHDALLPRPPDGMAPGATLAVLVHVGLIVALTLSVDWRTRAPEPVSAELWSPLPQFAAPKTPEPPTPTPVAPPPAPAPPPPAPAPVPNEVARDAQIATERAEQRRRQEQRELERQQALEREKVRKKEQDAEREKERAREQAREQVRLKAEADAEKKKRDADAKAQEARLAKQREEQMKRMLGSLPGNSNNPSSTGTASRDAAPSQAYVGRLVALIKSNVVFSDTVAGNPAAEVEVSTTAGGTILARRLVKSSGEKDWDEAVLRAIDRTGTLPRDASGRVPSPIIIVFRPKE